MPNQKVRNGWSKKWVKEEGEQVQKNGLNDADGAEKRVTLLGNVMGTQNAYSMMKRRIRTVRVVPESSRS